mgnify:CR=1 FL=1
MKTHQEKLNELKAEIRKAIPRLMELSEGCEIKIQYDVSFFITGKSFDTYYAVSENGWNFKTLDSIDIMETIGHEPLLNDVLEYFLEYTSLDFNTRQMAYILASWDLSKSKLSDQSPELINFLHDLIPNK